MKTTILTRLLSPKKGLQAMVLASLFLTLQIILVWFIETVFLFSFFLTFFLPMMMTFMMLFTPKKTAIIYFIVSLFIPFFVAPVPVYSLLFLILPNLLIGMVLGYALTFKWPLHHLFFVLTTMHYIFIYVTVAVFELFFSTSLMSLFFEHPFFDQNLQLLLISAPFVLFSISIVTIFITLFLFFPILERFFININFDFRPKLIQAKTLFILLLLHLLVFLFLRQFSFLFIGPILLITVYVFTYYLFNQQSSVRYYLLASLVFFLFMNSLMNPHIQRPYQLNAIVIVSWFTATIVLTKLLRKSNKIKIK
jgi:hypothetical protein